MLQRPQRPEKPYPDFPLRPHARGKWTKKIGGKSYYFGTWDDPYGALREYEQFLASGGPTTKQQDGTADVLTLYNAAQHFLDHKESQVKEGSIVRRTYDEYVTTAQRFCERMGSARAADDLRPGDYGLYRSHLVDALGWGFVTTSNEIVRVRTIMNWIYETYFPGQKPMFGPSFSRAGRKSMRRHKAQAKSKLLTPEVIKAILTESGLHFRAMVLLGINSAFGPTDCARLPLDVAKTAIENGWLVFPRSKTFVGRECALWPETIAALQDSLACRPEPKPEAERAFFVAPDGGDFDDDGKTYLIPGRWKAAKRAARIEHGSFYCLRHTFNTIAEQTGDQIAVKLVMGHADGTISENYRHQIGKRSIADQRLIRVAREVRDWLEFERVEKHDPFEVSPLT